MTQGARTARIWLLTTALALCSGCISVIAPPAGGPLGGKIKTAPVSDVAPAAIPASYEIPDELPPKEPAINVLAKERREP